MVSKVVGNLRLIVAVLALFGASNASAGLKITAESMRDFQFNGMTVEYNPQVHEVVVDPDNSESLSLSNKTGAVPSGSQGSSGAPVGNLYLSATLTDNGSLSNGNFWVEPPDSSATKLLEGSLRDIQLDPAANGFRFLVQENNVSGTLADVYRDNGLQVGVRVTNLSGTGLMSAYRDLVALDDIGVQNNSPSIPVPGTMALLLIAGLPLAAARRRLWQASPRSL
jgi:hypothetical protein